MHLHLYDINFNVYDAFGNIVGSILPLPVEYIILYISLYVGALKLIQLMEYIMWVQ